MKLDFAARALLGGVDDAGVKRTGVDVQTNGALIECAGIEDAVNGFEWIDGAGVRGVHLHDFGGPDDGLAESDVLPYDMKVFDQQPTDGYGHPAILVAMIVHGTGLADFPANGHQFIEGSFVDEVARVVLAIPGEIGSERVGVERSILQKSADLLGLIEGSLGELAEFGDEALNGNLSYGGGHGRLREKYSAGARADHREKLFDTGERGTQGWSSLRQEIIDEDYSMNMQSP
jgi:hypothetical protein